MTGKNFSPASVALIAIFSLSIPTVALSQGAFLRTVQPLDDESRGYCLDVAGFGPNINLESALRMHTCKYGETNEDQLFEWLETGQIHMPEYDLCLTADGISDGGKLFVQACSGTEEQEWTMVPTGRVSPASRADLCLTVADERSYAGVSPWLTPVYHARQAALAPCADSAQARQQLRWGVEAEQRRSFADTLGRSMPADLAEGIRRVQRSGGGSEETRLLYADRTRLFEPGEIEVAKDLAYGPHERHLLDVHTDRYRRTDGPMPVVMYFHGGGFVRGNREGSRNVADYFASLGLVGVNATYRLAPEAQFPSGAQDVGAAVAWVKEHIGEYGGDPDQIIVIGKSAGAAHVATYAFRPDVLAPGTPAPAGVVLISGTYGTDTTNANDGRLAYFGEDLSGWPRASTLGNVVRADLPVLMSVSEFDNPGTVRSLVELANELTVEHGRMPRIVQLIGHNHYSPNPSIGTQDTQLSAEILQFVRATAASRLQMSAR